MVAYSRYSELGPTQRLPNARARMEATPAHDGGHDRRWLSSEAGAETYLGALACMVFLPTKFTAEWAAGGRTISPLKFVAVSTTIVAVTWQLVQHGATNTTWLDLINSVTPALVFTLLGLLIHAAYKVFGSRRLVETSLGLTLFTSAGPGILFPLQLISLAWWAHAHSNAQLGRFIEHRSVTLRLAVALSAVATYLWPRIVLGRVLHAAHRRRWWWTVLATVFGELSVALLFGTLGMLHIDVGTYFGWPRLEIYPNLKNFGLMW